MRLSLSRSGLAAILCAAAIGFAPAVLGAFEVLDGVWPEGIAKFFVNPNFPDTELSGTPGRQVDIIRCGADAWREQSRADFSFEYQGTTNTHRLNSRDGVNAVFWSDADGGDALAVTLFSGGGGVAVSFDIAIFSTTDGTPNHWSGPGEPPAGTLDIQGVATHELGHGLGLGHSIDPDAIMFASIKGRGLPLRILHEDDRAGVEFLYDRRTTAPPAVEITGISPPSGSFLGGNEVILEGINFTYDTDTTVLVDGLPLSRADWQVESCGRLRIPSMVAGEPGRVTLEIENSIGSSTAVGAYEYIDDNPPVTFIRGDANRDGTANLSDAIFILDALFRGGPSLSCMDAADANDDGSADISDAVMILKFLFDGSLSALPPPFPGAGDDPTEDALSCDDR